MCTCGCQLAVAAELAKIAAEGKTSETGDEASVALGSPRHKDEDHPGLIDRFAGFVRHWFHEPSTDVRTTR